MNSAGKDDMSNQLKIERLVVGPLQVNSWIVSVDGQKEAVCIDPGDEAEQINALATEAGLEITKILLTHCHWDHINGVGELKKLTGAEIYCHRADLFLYEKNEEQSIWMGGSGQTLPPVDKFIDDNDIIEQGAISLKTMHTPGHSPGGVCFLSGNNCFVGDLVFSQSIGRSDLPGGNHNQLLTSISTKILTLPDSTNLYPGHGPATTVGDERELNPFFTNLP